MRMFEEFWWAAAMSRMDTRDAQQGVWTRGVYGTSRCAVPPEEVTTFNLVRRLAGRRLDSEGFSVALHSRPLEGGRSASGRVGSGADLELAVEVAPNLWIDIALQAKKFDPNSGRYSGWDPGQNQRLLSWAAANGRKGAGMILYNPSGAPFTRPGYSSSLFRACCSATVCHGWRWPRWQFPDGRSPLAVSLALDVGDPSISGLANPTPAQVADIALPWECLFCPNIHALKALPATRERPRWVEDVMSVLDQAGRPVGDAEEVASYSLALGMSTRERDDYLRNSV